VPPINVDEFVSYEKIKWSETLKLNLQKGTYASFCHENIRRALYRPFVKMFLYFDPVLDERRYQMPRIFPSSSTTNKIIWTKAGSEWPFFVLAGDSISDYLPQGGSRCFPFFTSDSAGTSQTENINSWLTLGGIPPAVFEYRLGNRSAFDWVIDQYRVTEDARTGMRSDPNREDDPEYIVRLVAQVIRVSMETVRIVESLPTAFRTEPETIH
jgi:predicted helicase